MLHIFGRYIWQYRYGIALFLVFAGIFAGVFFLYNLEIEAVLYAVLCCLLFLVVFVAVHFIFYYKRHRLLCEIRDNITLLAETLPPPRSLFEEDYQEMVENLLGCYKAALTEEQSRRSESIDYYTTWAHQIKTPIAAMRMILQGEDTDESRELLGELFRIEQYVAMVLCYFRLDSTSSDFVFKKYPLDAIIRQAIHNYAPQFVRKRIRLEYAGTQETVLTDEKWLLFILEQLLSNAVKYTQKGSVKIAVSPEKLVTVSDTGIGIAPEDLPRIFEKGFTGYNGRADKKSTGLGLYLCKQAADKLSIPIRICSEAGSGTTVFLDLRSAELEIE